MPAESIEGKNLLEPGSPVALTFKEVKYIPALKAEKNKNTLRHFVFQRRLLLVWKIQLVLFGVIFFPNSVLYSRQ